MAALVNARVVTEPNMENVMSQCPFCGYNIPEDTIGKRHAVGCPQLKSGFEMEKAIEVWSEGYQQVLGGGTKPTNASPTYRLGYLEAVVALELAETENLDLCLIFDTIINFDDIELVDVRPDPAAFDSD